MFLTYARKVPNNNNSLPNLSIKVSHLDSFSTFSWKVLLIESASKPLVVSFSMYVIKN